jgi:hypothetical protein
LKITCPFSILAKARPGPDQLGDPGPVGGATVAGERGDADLFGEHGNAGGHQDVDFVRTYPPDCGVGSYLWRPVDGHQRLRGADVPRWPPVRAQQAPQFGNGGGRPDDR